MSIGTPIDGAAGRDRTEGSFAMDKGGGWAGTVLGDAEGAEHNMD